MLTTGQRVLITGGGRGIGLALARKFHHAGNRVVLVGRDRDTLVAAAASLPGAIAHAADVSVAADRDGIVRAFPDIDVLVNNAGLQFIGAFAAADVAQIEAEIATNLVAPILLTRAYLPLLTQRAAAAIVNVSSVLALTPKQSASVYCATKAGLRSFTQSLRWQLEGTAVRVFEIVPPLVDTAMTSGRGSGKISPEQLAESFWTGFQAGTPEIRIGKAKAAALLSRFLPTVAERILRHG